MKKVVLIGDSIRMGYEHVVRRELGDGCDVITAGQNGGPSSRVLENLEEWALEPKPDLIHINAGLHDIKKELDGDESHVSLKQYCENLEAIFSRLRKESPAILVWASTTPVNEAWHHAKKGFERLEKDVEIYNEAAAEIARKHGLELNDLYAVVMDAGRDGLLRGDGVHFTQDGAEVLGKAVAANIRQLLRL